MAVEGTTLSKAFGDVSALQSVSFSVPEGKLLGLIGADGAGKSTLLRILVTLICADNGSAFVLGHNAATEFSAIRALVGYMPQKFSLYQDLSVRENMLFFADVFGVTVASRRERMERLLDFSRLAPFQDRRAADLSGGMKQKLALSCALIHTPKLLVLDEPTTGVDPVSRREFWEILFDLKRQGITIIVSTPYMDEAASCDLLLFLHKGAVLQQGTPIDLLAAYEPVLYRVSSTTGVLGLLPSAMRPPPGMSLIYPLAGELRIAGPAEASPEAILAHVRPFLPNAGAVQRIAPTIEDLLLFLLSEQEAA